MLVITGLLAVYTSSFAVGYHEFGNTSYFVSRQAVFALLGVGALVVFMRMDYNRLRAWSVPMLLLALLGLIAVLLPGPGVERLARLRAGLDSAERVCQAGGDYLHRCLAGQPRDGHQ